MNTMPQSSQHEGKQYLHTLVAGVWLPLLQSTFIASVIGISVLAIAYFIFDARDPYKPAILFFVVTWVYMTWKSQRHWWSLTTVEQILQRDINGDGVIGEATPQPEAKPRRVVIQLLQVTENGHVNVGDKSDTIKLSCSPDQLHTLAMGVLNGIPLAEKKWTPVKEGKPFSTGQWRKLCDEMREKELIEYVDEEHKEQGIRLTDTGKAVMKEYATLSPTQPETVES